MASADDVRRIASSLPEAASVPETGLGPDPLRFTVRDKVFAWTYQERIEGERRRVPRLDVVAVRVDCEETKQELLAAAPETFFTTDHYDGYPAVLVRLAAVDTAELTELLTDGWRCQAPKRLVREFDARGS